MRARRQSLYSRLSVAARAESLLTSCNSFRVEGSYISGQLRRMAAKSPQGEFSGSGTRESGEERVGWAETDWDWDWTGIGKESGSGTGTGSAVALALFEGEPQAQQLSSHKSSILTFYLSETGM
jgi:hypothetical protein